MYPELHIGSQTYTIDAITPIIGVILFIIIAYLRTKRLGLRFRNIASYIPMIIIVSLLCSTYVTFMLQSGKIIPGSRSQFLSIFSLSVGTIDFIGLSLGATVCTLFVLLQLPSKTRYQRCYMFATTYLTILIPLGVLYTMGTSVIGSYNDGFFSIGSFVDNSRIRQLGGSVYPVGLLISLLSSTCLAFGYYLYKKFSYSAGYWMMAFFIIGYILVLNYQHYPKHLVGEVFGLGFNLRVYVCIIISVGLLIIGRQNNRKQNKRQISQILQP